MDSVSTLRNQPTDFDDSNTLVRQHQSHLAAKPVLDWMKHIEIDFHFIWEYVNADKLKVAYIATKDQLSYILTKPLPKFRFVKLKTNLNMVPTMRLSEGIEDHPHSTSKKTKTVLTNHGALNS